VGRHDSLTVNLHLMMVSFFLARPRTQSGTDREIGVSLGSLRRRIAAGLHGLNEAQHLIEIEPRPRTHIEDARM